MVAKVLAIFAGLLFAGTIPASAPVTATIFSLAVIVALFEGDLRVVVGVIEDAVRVLRTVVDKATRTLE